METSKKYRGRAVAGQWAIQTIGEKRTPQVVGLLEVSMGPDVGQRIRYTGFLSEKACDATIAELRAMGWRGDRLGDWSGMGAKEVEFTCMGDVGDNGKTYQRAAFVRPVRTLTVQAETKGQELDALNRALGDRLSRPMGDARPGAASSRAPEPMPYDDDADGAAFP